MLESIYSFFSPISSFPVAVSFQNFTNAVCLDCGFSPDLKKKAAHVKLMNSACTPTWKPLYRWSFINCLNICISDCSRETIPAHMDNEQSPSRDKTISYRNYLALASLNCQGSLPFLSMLTQSSSFYGVTDCFCTSDVAHPRLLPIFLE